MKRRNLLAGVALFVAVLTAAQWVRLDVLRVESFREGRKVLLVPAGPGDTFVLSFIHSVERSVVRDFFRIDEGGRLVLYGTEFSSSNAGLPSVLTPGESLTRGEGGFRISGMHRVMEEVSLWVGESSGNRLTIHGVDHDLPGLAGETLLRVKAGTATAKEYLLFSIGYRHKGQERKVTKG
ncbi:MAG TPA: DUF1850 domain-containing protein [Syntrophales bacterium]|nr:DUF1850 domain-containing protein [Syntrophobacterales bacterium]HQL90141.1 DUF1850 domain-containing protein [Syntrophales bacterium]